MRSLSPSLLSAQKSSTAKPYVKVEVVQKLGAATRFDWTRLYTGAEADCFHAATLPGDGSLIRLRVASPGGTLYRQRVPSPGPGSDYATWTEWIAGGGGGAWLTGYGYRKQITIAGSTAGAQTNYQIKLTVYKGTGTDSAGVVYLNNHCQDDFDDVRFTKSDATTLLDYWIESKTVGTSMVVWIEFDSIPANPNTATFYIYYDNADATSGSNGNDTFLLFDDFDDASIDPAKWDTYGSPVETGGEIVCNGTLQESIRSDVTFQYKRLRARAIQGSSASDAWHSNIGFCPNWGGLTPNRENFWGYYNSATYTVSDNGTSEQTNIGNFLAAYHLFQVDWQSGNAKFYVDDVLKDTDTTYVCAIAINAMVSCYAAATTMKADWLFVANLCTPEPTWGTWGSEEVPTGGTYAVALCSDGAKVFAFRVGTNGNLYRCESTDNGASWGSWTDMGNIGASPANYRVACCFKNATNALVLYSNGTTLYRRRWNGTTWEAAAAWTNSLDFIEGIACFYAGDWNIVVTGRDPAYKNGVWTCILGDGYSAAPDSWSSLALLTISHAQDATKLWFQYPSISFPDVFRLFFVERYAGTEGYSRPNFSHSLASADFINNLWREPVPFNLNSEYGLALAYGGSPSYVWLTRPDGVWRSPLAPPSVELTDDVLVVTARTSPFSGQVGLALRNDDGRYNTLGTGTYEAIKKGSKILLSFGYRTTAGNESSLGPAYWIDGWEYVTRGGQSEFVLYATDGWALLERWKARRQFTWAKGDKNIFSLLSFLFSRAGLEFSSYSYSSAAVNQYPAFTIHPGESGLTAVKRLLAMIPDVILFVRDKAYLINPRTTDASDYSYGTDHVIYEGNYREDIQEANRAQVFGAGLMTEDWDWDEIKLVYDRLSQALDINLDTTAKGHQRGEAILREADIAAVNGAITVPLNCGQDLYDVIAITSSQAGLNASKRRVLALTHTWTPKKPKYTLKLEIGSP